MDRGMKHHLGILLCGLAIVLVASFGHAQSPDRRLRAGLSAGFDGTTFVNNPFNTLISEIRIPGISTELYGRIRFGKHFSIQLAPGYTIRPYRSNRTFIGDSLNADGTPGPFAGKTIDRQLRGNLHEFRLGMMFYFHFGTTQTGFHIGFGPEVQSVTLKKFDLAMAQDSVQFIHVSSDLVELPILPAVQVAGGYTWELPHRMLLQVEPYGKYAPIFVEDGKILSWATAGLRLKWWL
jgi:hypothetical protein